MKNKKTRKATPADEGIEAARMDVLKSELKKKIGKPYLVAIKDEDIFAFKTLKERNAFLSELKKRFPNVPYATSKLEV